MKPRIFICRSIRNHTTTAHISGPVARIKIEITSYMNARQRRAIAVSFFRQIKPFLAYFRQARIIHSRKPSLDFEREENRGLNLFRSASIETKQGKLGFRIRLERLERGWTQSELARQTGVSKNQISRIERGLTKSHLNTIRRIERVTGVPLLDLAQSRNGEKVELAQGQSISSRNIGS